MSTLAVFAIIFLSSSVFFLGLAYSRIKKDKDIWMNLAQETQEKLEREMIATRDFKRDYYEIRNKYKEQQQQRRRSAAPARPNIQNISSSNYIGGIDDNPFANGLISDSLVQIALHLPDNPAREFWLEMKDGKLYDHSGHTWDNYSDPIHCWRNLKGYRQIQSPMEAVSAEEINQAKQELPDILKELTQDEKT